MSHSAS